MPSFVYYIKTKLQRFCNYIDKKKKMLKIFELFEKKKYMKQWLKKTKEKIKMKG